MDISIIIVNYNMRDLCIGCINSVYEKTKDVNFEIIVVDNNSTDGLTDVIKTDYPQIKLIESPENLGFGRANNEAIKIATGKYVFCLNPDTLLINNSVKILYDFMETHPECAAAGGNLYDKDLTPVFSCGYGDDIKSLILRKTFLKIFFLSEFFKIRYFQKKFDRNKIQEVNHISGADLMLRKSVLDKVGYFSDKIFMYFEETELQFRIRKAGYKLLFVPESKIIHLEDKYRNNKHTSRYLNESFVEYYRLCYGDAWGEIAEFLTRNRRT